MGSLAWLHTRLSRMLQQIQSLNGIVASRIHMKFLYYSPPRKKSEREDKTKNSCKKVGRMIVGDCRRKMWCEIFLFCTLAFHIDFSIIVCNQITFLLWTTNFSLSLSLYQFMDLLIFLTFSEILGVSFTFFLRPTRTPVKPKFSVHSKKSFGSRIKSIVGRNKLCRLKSLYERLLTFNEWNQT